MMQGVYGSPYGLAVENRLHEIWAGYQTTVRLIERLLIADASLELVVDLGCGDGSDLEYLIDSGCKQSLVGIDKSKVAIQKAKQRLGNRASIISANICEPILFSGGKFLAYASGFTANLFPQDEWLEIIKKWFDQNTNLKYVVYDYFLWKPVDRTVAVSGEYRDAGLKWRVFRDGGSQSTVLEGGGNEDSAALCSFNHCELLSPHSKLNGVILRELFARRVNPGDGLEKELRTVLVGRVS